MRRINLRAKPKYEISLPLQDVCPVAGWLLEMAQIRASVLTETIWVTDCCIYIEVAGYLFCGLSEGNSVLSHTGISSFKNK